MIPLLSKNINCVRRKCINVFLIERVFCALPISNRPSLIQWQTQAQRSYYFHARPNLENRQLIMVASVKLSFHSYFNGSVLISRGMAGHSKWQNIKSTKEKNDRLRSILFSRHSLYIRRAIQEGGGSCDPKVNSKLAAAIEMAKNNHVPNANIENALKSSQVNPEDLQRHVCEVVGPGGCFIIVEILTSKIKRTQSEIRFILKKHASTMAQTGGAMHAFNQKGVIVANKESENTLTAEEAMDDAIEVGAEEVLDISSEDDQKQLQFTCDFKSWSAVTLALKERGFSVKEAGQEYIPMFRVKLGEVESVLMEKLWQALEDLPEVVKVYDNVE